jgi:hypothetical protein
VTAQPAPGYCTCGAKLRPDGTCTVFIDGPTTSRDGDVEARGAAAPVLTTEEYRAWRQKRSRADLYDHIRATGLAPVRLSGDAFLWTCPGCGGTAIGTLGDQPVSGWDEPRWVRSGPDDALTLTPSLGCPRWRYGQCTGHWWLRDGRLVAA